MTLSEAKHEFGIRMYYWHVSEFEKEMNASFPNLRLFKSGLGWKLYHFMQRLKPSDQLMLAHARLNIAYSSEMGELGVAIAEEGKNLVESFREFALQPSTREFEILLRKKTGEKIKFASKRKLRNAMVSKFNEAFGSQWVHTETGEGWDPQFHMRCCGWIINTQLVLGRRQGVVWYRHMIESETRIPHRNFPTIMVPATTLSSGVAWLEYRWEDVLDDEVEAVSGELVKIARLFFEAAPRLLKGLEFETVNK
jgi:hypothetical protein